MLQILFALLAGLLTVGSACTLPMLPILLGVSVGQKSKTRPLFIALGFIFTFMIISLALSVLTKALGISQSNLQIVGAVFLLILGFFMVFPIFFEKIALHMGPLINKVSSVQSRASKGNLGGFFIGASMGVIWAPCAGPVLGAILTLIATAKDLTSAGLLLLFYSIGAAIPMILIAYGGQYFTTKVRVVGKYLKPIQQVFGVLIIILAIITIAKPSLLVDLENQAAGTFHLITNPRF